MAREKRDPKAVEIADLIIKNFNPKTALDIDNTLTDVFSPIVEQMLQGEMKYHLGYDSNDHLPKETENRRNGFSKKTIKTSSGKVTVDVPRDRDASFNSDLLPKYSNDLSNVETLILSLYSKGLSQHDIQSVIKEIYRFDISVEKISSITDTILPYLEEWQTRPLKKMYAFTFVDCIYVHIRNEYETKSMPVYVILTYDLKGHKDILGLWISETESKTEWLKIFDELKVRGVEDVGFISVSVS